MVKPVKNVSQVLFQVGKIISNADVIEHRGLYLNYHPETVPVQCLTLTIVTSQEVGGIKMLFYRYLIHSASLTVLPLKHTLHLGQSL